MVDAENARLPVSQHAKPPVRSQIRSAQIGKSPDRVKKRGGFPPLLLQSLFPLGTGSRRQFSVSRKEDRNQWGFLEFSVRAGREAATLAAGKPFPLPDDPSFPFLMENFLTAIQNGDTSNRCLRSRHFIFDDGSASQKSRTKDNLALADFPVPSLKPY